MKIIDQKNIESELNKLDVTIKHAIKISLEDAGLLEYIDSSKIGEGISTYEDCKNIIDYIYLKIKEYFLSDYFIRALECFNSMPYNYKKEKIITNINFYESDFIDRYLFYKNGYNYDSTLNSTENHEKQNNTLINLKKHLVADMKEIFVYSHKNMVDIVNLYQNNQNNLSNDSLKNFYYWTNNKFNQYVFLCGCTPVKYVSFVEESKQRKVPLFFEYITIVFSDLFFKTTNHLSKASTNINNLKTHKDNNNICKLIESYNNSLEIVKKIQNMLISSNESFRANVFTHYINSIFANDFFKAIDSTFLKFVCGFINLKKLYDYSENLYINHNNKYAISQRIVIDNEIFDITNNLQYLNILEFGVKYNINFSKFDCFLNREYSGIDTTQIINKVRIEKFCMFLYLLYNNTSLCKLNICFPKLSTDMKEVIKILNNQLYHLGSRDSKIDLININSRLYKNNYLLFSYLFLYSVRHPNFSIQGKKANI